MHPAPPNAGAERPPQFVEIAPGLRRVLAPNPSPMTLHGTNSYILGEGVVAIIDPGPADPVHHAALRAALRPGERIGWILVTHAHLDHSPLAAVLARESGAPVAAFGTSDTGRSAAMAVLAESDLAGGEGVDRDFRPDEILYDGAEIDGPGWRLTAVHTPGHFGNHLSFLWGDVAFSGDHVMGWATTLISPPDGDLGDFMRSLDRLARTGARRLYPGHGAPVPDAQARIAEMAAHRRARTAQILSSLSRSPGTSTDLARRLYTDTPPMLLPAATRNVFAHLIELAAQGRVHHDGPIGHATLFHAT